MIPASLRAFDIATRSLLLTRRCSLAGAQARSVKSSELSPLPAKVIVVDQAVNVRFKALERKRKPHDK